MTILILNGPNLNLTGKREPSIYGRQNLDDYLTQLTSEFPQHEIICRQTNHEGQLIDWLQAAGYPEECCQQGDFGHVDAVILNAGGYTHTSVALRDTVSAISMLPVVELHISNTTQREAFRRYSYLRDVCVTCIQGQGLDGYRQAIIYLQNYQSGK